MKSPLALALVLALSGSALAQPDDPALRSRIRERVRSAIEQKLTAILQLDAPTAARFQQVLDRYDAQIVELQKDAAQAHRELKQHMDGGGTDAATINRLADRMLDDHSRVQRLETDRSREVRGVLSAQQYGRLMIVYPDVVKGIKQQLWKALADKRAEKNAAPELE